MAGPTAANFFAGGTEPFCRPSNTPAMSLRLWAVILSVVTLLAGVSVPSQEQIHDDMPQDHRAEFSAMSSSIQVTAHLDGEALVGHAVSILVEATSPVDLRRAVVAIDAPPGVDVEDGRRVYLPAGETVTVAFQATVLEAGMHTIKATVIEQARVAPAWGADILYVESDNELATVHASPPIPNLPAATLSVAANRVRAAPLQASPGVAPEPWIAPDAAVHAPRDVDTFTVSGCWAFVDPDGQTLWPQRWATVRLLEVDADRIETLGIGFTGDDGCFASGPIPVLEPAHQAEGGTPQDMVVEIDLCNSYVCVAMNQLGSDWSFQIAPAEPITAAGDYALGTFLPADPTGQAAGRTFQYTNNAWDFAVNHLGIDPAVLGDATVRIPYLADDAAAFYVAREDTIFLGVASHPESPDVVGHEYGHFVMDKLNGDIYNPSRGGTHAICDDGQSPGLSWSEGWANYFGARVNREVTAPGADGDAMFTYAGLASLPMEDRVCQTSIKGYDNEFNVAQFLWDLRDAEPETARARLGIPGEDTTALDHAVMVDGLLNCFDANLGDYFNGQDPDSFSPVCNWDTLGHDTCGFVNTALWNNIDVNTRPLTTVTQPAAFATLTGPTTVAATVEDPDCPDILGVQFGLFTRSDCRGGIAVLGVDRSSPFEITFDTARYGSLPEVWVCARAHDNLHGGSWGIAASHVEFANPE